MRFFLSAIVVSFVVPLIPAIPGWTQGPPSVGALLQGSAATLTNGVAINDVTVTATVRRMNGAIEESGTATLTALATGEARTDFVFPSGTQSEIHAISGQGPTGSWSAPDGTSRTIPLHNLMTDPAWFSPAIMLSKLIGSQVAVASFVGTETRSGVSVQHISVSKQFSSVPARVSADLQRLSQMEIYLDAASQLPVSVTFNTHPDTNARLDIPVEIRYSNYQKLNSQNIAFHIEEYLYGGLILELDLQKSALNTGLTSTMFSVPTSSSAPTLRSWQQ